MNVPLKKIALITRPKIIHHPLQNRKQNCLYIFLNYPKVTFITNYLPKLKDTYFHVNTLPKNI